jgi:hypothetical protein
MEATLQRLASSLRASLPKAETKRREATRIIEMHASRISSWMSSKLKPKRDGRVDVRSVNQLFKSMKPHHGGSYSLPHDYFVDVQRGGRYSLPHDYFVDVQRGGRYSLPHDYFVDVQRGGRYSLPHDYFVGGADADAAAARLLIGGSSPSPSSSSDGIVSRVRAALHSRGLSPSSAALSRMANFVEDHLKAVLHSASRSGKVSVSALRRTAV